MKRFNIFIVVVLAVLCFVLLSLATVRKPVLPVGPAPSAPDVELSPVQVEHLRRDITILTEDYQSDCERLLAKFMSHLEESVAADFAKADAAVPQVVSDLSGFGNCASLSYKAAKDKIMGTNDFGKRLEDVIRPAVLSPCSHAYQLADDQLRTLNQRLQERSMEYVQSIAALNSQYGGDVGLDSEKVFKEFGESLDRFRKLVVEKQMKTVSAGIGVAFEALFIRSTIAAIRNLFVKISGKLAGSVSAGVICAAADGPIPIGDVLGAIIAAGGTIWTAWDIWDVSHIMPKKLASELKSGIASAKRDLLAEARRNAETLVKQFQEESRALSATALAQL